MESTLDRKKAKATCRYCGVASDWWDGFVDESGVRDGPGDICVTCKTYRDRFPLFYGNLALGIITALTIGFGITGSVFESVLIALFSFLGLHATIVLHEFGHAAAAFACGVKVPVFSFGGGHRVRVIQLAKSWLVLGLLPTEGLIVIQNESRRWYRIKSVVISAAGPLANIVCAGILYYWLEYTNHGLSTFPLIGLQLFVVFNLFTGITNLIPFSSTTPFGSSNSDGKCIVDSLILTSEQIDEYIAFTTFTKAYIEYLYGSKKAVIDIVEPILEDGNEQVAIKVLASAAYAEVNELDKGKHICRSALKAQDLQRVERASLLNNLAYLLEFENTPESLAEADEHSKEAFELTPMLLSTRSTRAAVLASLGRAAEALELTNDKRFKIEPKLNQARVLCTQAIAYHKLGETALAEMSIRDAESMAPLDSRVIAAKELVLPVLN